MIRMSLVAASLLVCSMASAQAPAAAPAPIPAPADAAPPAAPTNPLAEPADLVENGPNNKETLRKAIALYDERLKDANIPAKDRAAGYADEARAYLRLGDLETSDAAKLDAYGKGRAAAQKGQQLDPKNVDALFWDMANLATTGRTKGVMNSLFMLPELRKGLTKCLEMNPNFLLARQTLGEIDHAVPGLAGGSDERAEKGYLENLKRDPRYTPTMAQLAKLYKDKGDDDKAKEWANKCIAGPSSVPNDWKKFNKKDCQQVLKDLE
jgi:tetratricopeptide (TPR) repeat protein